MHSENIEHQNVAPLSIKETSIVLVVLSLVSLISNWAGTGNSVLSALPGMMILFAIIVVSLLLKKAIPLALPAVAWVSLVSVLITLPVSPIAEPVLEQLKTINFLSMVTPVLAYAAIAIGRSEIDLFKKSGLKIILISLLVFTGTFLGSVVVANAFL
ncbi:hypothetical protein [Photobacterium sp.]|uniref:hypothetical protein n=1 Tax=Photobacterium sp. TaxID=660 RepID=UPI00299DBD36|nr:hypothetical protein [Photobacterium sp.]MDX1303592.1 hypothetical protein [Photobacterium sp.]